MAEPKAAVTQLERQKGKVGFNIRPPPKHGEDLGSQSLVPASAGSKVTASFSLAGTLGRWARG